MKKLRSFSRSHKQYITLVVLGPQAWIPIATSTPVRLSSHQPFSISPPRNYFQAPNYIPGPPAHPQSCQPLLPAQIRAPGTFLLPCDSTLKHPGHAHCSPAKVFNHPPSLPLPLAPWSRPPLNWGLSHMGGWGVGLFYFPLSSWHLEE